MAEPPKPKITVRRLRPDEPQPERKRPPAPAPPPPVTPPRPPPPRGGPSIPPAPAKPSEKRSKPSPSLPAQLTKESGPAISAGRFHSASGALALLGTIAGRGEAPDFSLMRSPSGQWWCQVGTEGERTAPLILAAGGLPYVRVGNAWTESTELGEPIAAKPIRLLDLSDWTQSSLAELLSCVSLRPAPVEPSAEMAAIVPGALSRNILRRALALQLEVMVTSSLRQPLGQPNGPESGIMLFQYQARRGGVVPTAFISSLARLPYIISGPLVRSDRGAVIVDSGHRLPISSALLANLTPPGECWVIGGPGNGTWRVRPHGEEIDGAALLDLPDLPTIDVPAQRQTSSPGKIRVELVPRPGGRQTISAVLLDEQELRWVIPLLKKWPATETVFVILGETHHLLTSPGGLGAGSVPLGIPLTHCGPGGLHIQIGTDFHPALPDGARRERFGLQDHTVIAVAGDRTYRFDAQHLVPAWALWVGEIPAVVSGLPRRASAMLDRINDLYRQAEMRPKPVDSELIESGVRRVNRDEIPELLATAQREALAGNLIRAAELLEQAGYPGPAGRLYERAAGI